MKIHKKYLKKHSIHSIYFIYVIIVYGLFKTIFSYSSLTLFILITAGSIPLSIILKNYRPKIKSNPGNLITLIRSFTIPLILVFILIKSKFLLVTLYSLNLILDYLDGFIGRKTRTDTKTRRKIDNEFDSIALVYLTITSAINQWIPRWMIIIGLMHYIFYLSLTIRNKLWKKNHRLPKSRMRRVIGAFSTTLLLPIILISQKNIITFLGSLMVISLLYSFIRDWLIVTGKIK